MSEQTTAADEAANAAADRVAVWDLDSDDEPTDFLGYGTLADSRVVLLHPPELPPDGAFGWAAPAAAPDGPADLPRVRTRIRRGHHREVIDGRLVSGTAVAGVALSIVYLDAPSAAEPDDLPWPQRTDDPEAEQGFLARIAALRAGDPRPPSRPGPAEADPWHHRPVPFPPRGWRPPWCLLFPRCPGCS